MQMNKSTILPDELWPRDPEVPTAQPSEAPGSVPPWVALDASAEGDVDASGPAPDPASGAGETRASPNAPSGPLSTRPSLPASGGGAPASTPLDVSRWI